MENTRISITVSKETQQQAQQLFDDLGLDMATAVNMFLKQSVREQCIPFSIRRDIPNDDTLEAFAEGDMLLCDPTAKRFSSVEKLFEDLNSL